MFYKELIDENVDQLGGVRRVGVVQLGVDFGDVRPDVGLVAQEVVAVHLSAEDPGLVGQCDCLYLCPVKFTLEVVPD